MRGVCQKCNMVLEGSTRDVLDENFHSHIKTWHSEKDIQAGITFIVEGGENGEKV